MSKERCRGAGLHCCYLPTPLREGTGEESAGFLVKGKCPWGKCLAWGNIGLVNAISAALQQTTGVSDRGAAFGGEVAVMHGVLMGSTGVMGSTAK